MARRDEVGTGTAVLDRETLDTSANGTEGTPEGAEATGAQDGATGAGEGEQSTAAASTARVRRDPAQMGPEEIISLNVRIPNALRAMVAKTAEEQQTSVPQLVATMLASAYSFELPKPARPARIKKYSSPEERKQAQKDQQAKQRLITKAVLRAVEQGTLNLDVDALIAEIKAEETAKAAGATEGAAS